MTRVPFVLAVKELDDTLPFSSVLTTMFTFIALKSSDGSFSLSYLNS